MWLKDVYVCVREQLNGNLKHDKTLYIYEKLSSLDSTSTTTTRKLFFFFFLSQHNNVCLSYSMDLLFGWHFFPHVSHVMFWWCMLMLKLSQNTDAVAGMFCGFMIVF